MQAKAAPRKTLSKLPQSYSAHHKATTLSPSRNSASRRNDSTHGPTGILSACQARASEYLKHGSAFNLCAPAVLAVSALSPVASYTIAISLIDATSDCV